MKKVTMEEYKTILLDTLITIDRLCRENDIPYVIFYGTLLGAVRHGGFIPWDDDIDIAVPRDDFPRLQAAVNAAPERDHINFIYIDTNDDTIYSGGKICDTTTVLKESSFKAVKGYGAFVDVFPFDHLPDNQLIRTMDYHFCRLLHRIALHSAMDSYEESPSRLRSFLRMVAHGLTRGVNTQKLLKFMIRHFQKRNNMETRYIGLPYEKYKFDSHCFDHPIELAFEGHMFYAPRQYDAVLQECYGDYMTLPPEEDRINKHMLHCYKQE